MTAASIFLLIYRVPVPASRLLSVVDIRRFIVTSHNLQQTARADFSTHYPLNQPRLCG